MPAPSSGLLCRANKNYEEADKIFRKYLDGTINPKDISNKEARELAIEIRDYIDEFNRMFTLDEKKKIFGIEGKEIQMGQRNGGITRL